MPRKISRLGGTTLRRSFMTNAYSPAICTWGPRHGPQSPFFRAAPAKPWRPSISDSSEQPAMLGHHAAVLDDADPGAREALGGRVVPDAELKPHGLWAPG